LSQESLIAAIVSAAIASAGLWWFRLVLPVVQKQPKNIRYTVYALIWLAYFILAMILIGRAA